LVAAAKFLVEATKKLFVIPNFVAVTKPFFSVICCVCAAACGKLPIPDIFWKTIPFCTVFMNKAGN